VVDERAGAVFILLVLVFTEDRDKGLRKCALCKQAAQHVGQAEGNVEGIGHHPRAQHIGDQDFAHQAKDAGDQGEAADFCKRLE